MLWLCSPQATLTVGHAMVVDGGQTEENGVTAIKEHEVVAMWRRFAHG